MKRVIILLSVYILLAMSCSSIRQARANNELRNNVKQQEIKNAVESDRYIVKVNRLFTRRGFTVDLVPTYNYIIIDKDLARITLAYTGRSFDIRGITGINMTGRVIEKKIDRKRNGMYKIKLKVKQNNDLFTVNISTGTSGYCSVNITHPRIESTRYHGSMYGIN
ncbi:MAG: DUF4251 domain-containing protein [Bacteroidales bacterium]|nr:DUF4251 domain-containing protein [Bacteroidales bacterium]